MAELRIGLVYDLLGSAPGAPDAPPDADVEYEPEETVAALEAAVRAAGGEPVRLGNPHDLLRAAAAGPGLGIDCAWNIAEGYGSRNREAWAPVLLEMAEIPVLGSNALTQSLSLDKAWTLDVVAAAGVRTAGYQCLDGSDVEGFVPPGSYPLFVKPRWEGTAKGIDAHSKVAGAAELERAVARILERYEQPALVEPFLPGAEYTVSLVGAGSGRSLGVLQRALEAESGIGLHAVDGRRWTTPGDMTDALVEDLVSQAQRAYEALRCLDFARVDFKCDAAGVPLFLEINPLPTFAPDSSFAILAEMEGRPYDEYLADVLRLGLRRLGLGD